MALRRNKALLLRVAFLSLVLVTSADSTVSIWSEDGFDTARACVQEAFHKWAGGGLWNGALQCEMNGNDDYLNSCACRCDLQPIAESYISSYVKSGCSSNTVDIQSGILLYDAYCATAVTSSCTGYTTQATPFVLPTIPDSTVSIWSEDGFDAARVCVQEAFHKWAGGGLWNGALQCEMNGNDDYLNSCACRCDLQPIAESYISSYVKSGCSSNSADIQSGISLYDAYCATAVTTSCAASLTQAVPGSPQVSPQAAPTLTQTTSQASGILPTDSNTTPTSLSPSTSISSSTNDSTNSGLSRSDKIALGTGLAVPIAALLVAVIGVRYQRNAARRHRRGAY